MTIQQDLKTSHTAFHPFSEGQWQQLQALLETFTEKQAFWLSGFLAARNLPAKSAVLPSVAARILIAYGTETGNSKGLAEQLAQRLSEQNLPAKVVSLAELKARALAKTDYLFLICSTHGDGDPPEPAVPFFEALQDERLAQLGAQRLVPRRDCDVDFQQPAGEWLEQVLNALPRPTSNTIPASDNPQHLLSAVKADQTYSKQHPFMAEVLDNIRLSA